jgi:DNA-binding FadR family transcriptional regulator
MVEKDKSASLVRRTAHQLRVLISRSQPGDLVGFEDDLLKLLGVSRPTLRQAATLVAQEQLLTVRRGSGGGYFARIPSSKAVAHIAAIYLQAHKTELREIIQAMEPNMVELARLSARNRTEEHVCALRAFVKRETAVDDVSLTRSIFLKTMEEHNRLIAVMSGNHVLSLVLEILYDSLVLHISDIEAWIAQPERVRRFRAARLQLCGAILSGDEEVAALMSARCTREFTEWMLHKLAQDGRKAGGGNASSTDLACP